MRRPIDPRNHGLREPDKTFTKIMVLRLSSETDMYWKKQPLSLQTAVNAWNKALKDHLAQGWSIVKEPAITEQLNIVYTIGWDNDNYAAELADYNKQVAKYEEELASFLTTEKELSELPADHSKVLDIKIQRAKERLANLEAMRDKKPLPFP